MSGLRALIIAADSIATPAADNFPVIYPSGILETLRSFNMLKSKKLCALFRRFARTASLLLLFVLANFGLFVSAQNRSQGKTPVIIIPGFFGSELVNQKNAERVWFRLARSKKDDLRLPLSENLEAMRDNLFPREAFRGVKIGFLPRFQIYGSLIKSLKKQGYEERSWENPKAADALYVFAYDWRRDNVENAKLLIEKIEDLKKRLNQPDLKFNVVAHSMGGLVARYAAMYGKTDLPGANHAPPLDWAGAKHFDRLILIGTPNQGSLLALKSLADNFALFPFNLDLPFVQKITKFDFFTFPAMFQLLPSGDALKVYDENLRAVKIDVFDPQTWDKYGWGAINDPAFAKRFAASERRVARAYFLTALKRAKNFQAALNRDLGGEKPISIFILGADCKTTLDAIVVRRAAKTKNWQTVFKAKQFLRSDGRMVTTRELKNIMFAPGDGMVSKRSLTNEPAQPLSISPAEFQCKDHSYLVKDSLIQASLIKLLRGK